MVIGTYGQQRLIDIILLENSFQCREGGCDVASAESLYFRDMITEPQFSIDV